MNHFISDQHENSQPEEAPLSVVLASTQTHWRGGEQQARLLLEGLRSHGHQVTLMARKDSQMAEKMTKLGFEVITFAGKGRSASAIWKIRKALKKIKPDVLHFNDSHALTSAGIASIGLPIAAKVIARRVNFLIRSPWRYHRFADRMICVSQSVKQVSKEAGFSDDDLAVVYDGVDPARMASGNRQRGRQELELSLGQPMLLTIAALSDDKGHAYLFEAMPDLLKQYPDLCLALAGAGELEEELKKQVKELGIEKNVRFLGFRDDIADLIYAADLCVMPSVVEGLCSTLIDVMLAGCPIVATTAGGIPELIGYQGNEPPVGWLVPPRDPQQLSFAIQDAFSSPRLREANIIQAKRRAELYFTAETMVRSTLDVYRQIIAEKTKKVCPAVEQKKEVNQKTPGNQKAA